MENQQSSVVKLRLSGQKDSSCHSPFHLNLYLPAGEEKEGVSALICMGNKVCELELT